MTRTVERLDSCEFSSLVWARRVALAVLCLSACADDEGLPEAHRIASEAALTTDVGCLMDGGAAGGHEGATLDAGLATDGGASPVDPSTVSMFPVFKVVGSACSREDTTLQTSAEGRGLTVQYTRFGVKLGASEGSVTESCKHFLPISNETKAFALRRVVVEGRASLPEGVQLSVLTAPLLLGDGNIFVNGNLLFKRLTVDGPRDGRFRSEVSFEGPELAFTRCSTDITQALLSFDASVQRTLSQPSSSAEVDIEQVRLEYETRDCK